MGSNNSIFDFADKFGVESPFGDWMKGFERQTESRNNGRSTTVIEPTVIDSSDHERPRESMILLHKVVEPDNYNPGNAQITIGLKYKVVTSGEGLVPNVSDIDKLKFKKLFSLGNAPGLKYNEGFRWTRLPSQKSKPIMIKEEELKLSRQMDMNGHPLFWNYYVVNVKYEIEVEIAKSFTLWNGIIWMEKNIETTGIILNPPFNSELDYYYKCKYQLSLKTLKKELQSTNGYTSEELTDEFLEERRNSRIEDAKLVYESLWFVFLIVNLINANIDKYREKTIYVEPDEQDSWGENTFISSNPQLASLMSTIGSEFVLSKPNQSTFEPILLDGLDSLLKYVNPISESCIGLVQLFKDGNGIDETTSRKLQVGAAGLNPRVGKFSGFRENVIVTNPKYFKGKSNSNSIKIAFNQPLEELLVHEAGHNAANRFIHSEFGYSYEDRGLSSNKEGQVYPTMENTFGICEDYFNRKYMKLL